MKELTGNDEITARPLFEAPITFKPQIKFAIPCNNLPDVPARDKGTWRRLRVIDHKMEFVDNPKKANERKIDRTLKERLEDLAPQFMAFLIDRYINVYCKTGLQVPESVSFATNMYNQENNCIKSYVEENIQQTGKKTDRLTQKTLWESFKEYFKKEQEGNKRPQQKELSNYLTSTYGKPVAGKSGGPTYSGIMFIDYEDDDGNDVDM